MEKNKNDLIKHVWEKSWTYIKTVVDVVHEPVLILDKDLQVMAANEAFYRMFQVEQKDTEGRVIYKLGNGQWDIPALRKLLEDILPYNTFFKGFEVTHIFPSIGEKVMILNARQIYFKEDPSLKSCPPIILLAMEDITEMMAISEQLGKHINALEGDMAERITKIEMHMMGLAKK